MKKKQKLQAENKVQNGRPISIYSKVFFFNFSFDFFFDSLVVQ